MLLSELYRVLPDNENVLLIQEESEFVLEVQAKYIPAYLLDATVKTVTMQEMALLRIELHTVAGRMKGEQHV